VSKTWGNLRGMPLRTNIKLYMQVKLFFSGLANLRHGSGMYWVCMYWIVGRFPLVTTGRFGEIKIKKKSPLCEEI